MKANELRIGNLVNVPREDQSPFRIDAFEHLSSTYIKVKMIHPEFGDKMHPLTWYDEDLTPIQLTEEWLLKFGFEKIEDTSWYFEYRIDKKNIISFDKDHKEYSYFNLSSRLCQLKYVHQLQNIYFSLTQQELKIK